MSVAHPDGSYWFTDPPYGGQLYEGEPDSPGGPSNAGGKLNPRIGQPAGFVPGNASSRPIAIASILAAASTSW